MSPEFTCRMATPSDSVQKIAKYLHLTDPYIYPLICKDPEDSAWCEFIRACTLSEGNLCHLSNLAVLLHGEEIVGVACVAPCGQKLTVTEGIQVPDKLGIAPVNEGYFLPLIKEMQAFSGFNIVNICVDAAYRGQGLGKKLMAFCMEHCGNTDIHLDVISDNTPAIRLYESLGFQISSEYMGFSGSDTKLPCYHMIKKATP